MSNGKRTQRSRAIGVLSPFLGYEFFGSLLEGIRTTACEQGYQVIGIQTSRQRHPTASTHTVSDYAPYAIDQLDGLILILQGVAAGDLRSLQQQGKHLVTICVSYPELGIPSVFPDNRGGMREIVRHLIEHGHRRIAFAGDLSNEDVRQRHGAFQAALRAAGIEPDPDLLYPVPDMVETGGIVAAEAVLAANVPCSAICVATDRSALAFLAHVQGAGIRVPADLAVTGFDDSALIDYYTPALTTVQQDFAAVGAAAARVLLALQAGEPTATEPIYIPSRPVIRQSCGCGVVDQRHSPSAERVQAPASAVALKQAMLRETARVSDQETAPRRRMLTAALDRIVDATVTMLADGPRPNSGDLSELWRDVCACANSIESVNRIVGLLEDFARSSLSAQHYPPVVHERLAAVLEEIHLELLYGFRRRYAGRIVDLERDSRHSYLTSLQLSEAGERGVRDLSWLQETPIIAACLGLWDGEPGMSTLSIAGVYGADAATPDIAGMMCRPQDFPPAEVFDRFLQDGTNGMIVVMPLQSSTKNWGALAILRPAEAQVVTNTSSEWQWAVMLMAALEREALTMERERLVKSLGESEARYALAVRGASDGLWDWNLSDNMVYYSPRWKEMLGYAASEIGTHPRSWFDLVHADDVNALETAFTEQIATGVEHVEHEYRIRHKNGEYRWMLCRAAVVWHDGYPQRIAGSQTDISASKEREVGLVHLAAHDALTGLANRRLFGECIAQCISEDLSRFTLLVLDLDDFKDVNDTLGHIAGDALLKAIAHRLASALRATDTVARIGGDEFVVLLPLVGDTGARRALAKIRATVEEPIVIEHHVVQPRVSIGYAVYPKHGDNYACLLRRADAAMYAEKRARHDLRRSFELAVPITEYDAEGVSKHLAESCQLR